MISYKDLLSFFSPLANIFCYIYNQGKDVCNFLFLYIPDSHYYLLFSMVNNVFDTNIFRQVKTGNFISKAHVYLNSWYITWLQNSCNVTWFHMWREKYETCLHHLYCSKLNTYMSQIKHFTADRSNPFTHRYHILTIRK
jgi:hypothetical protein